MNVTLHLRQSGQELIAELDFINDGPDTVHLLKYKIGVNGKISNRLFNITTKSNDEKVDYTGILKKRKPPTAEDYVVLLSGEHLRTTIRIDESYNFTDVPMGYEIYYSAIHAQPSPGKSLLKLESNKVEIFFP